MNPDKRSAALRADAARFHALKGSWYQFKVAITKRFYFNLKKRVEFYRIVRTLTANGVSIQTALKLYGDMIFKYYKDASMKFIIDDILGMMTSGVRFERAIALWVPAEEHAVIESSSKDVARACEVVTVFAENMMSIRGALSGALAYPIMMLVLLIGCLIGFSTYIMPMMVKISPPSAWPLMAQNLYAVTNFISAHILGLGMVIVATFAIVSWSMSHFTFKPVRKILDKLPPWNIYKLYTSTSFLIALSSLIKTGSSFNHSLNRMKETSNPFLSGFLSQMQLNLSRGRNFGDSLVVGLFEGSLLISLSVFAMTNRLEKGIAFLADENLEEQQQVFVKKGKILGYTLMMVVAGVIGWAMLSIYGIQSSIQVGV